MTDSVDFLEKWPAHATGRSYARSQVSVVNSRIVPLSEVETKISNLVPKPKFLETLEKNIADGLKDIQPGDRDSRFQIFKEAFQSFICSFKTYKHFLSRIYQEYEEFLNFYKAEAQKLRPVKEYLWTISQECDERILKIQKKEKPEINSLRREIVRLRDLISELKEEKLGLETQVGHLTQSLKEEHEKFRYEADAKLLLISEINAMRMQFDEIEVITKHAQNKTNENDDPILLKIALEQARKAQSVSEFELVQLKAEYVNVMPKNRYDMLLEENLQLKNDFEAKMKEYEGLNESFKLLKNQLNEVMKQRDESESKIQQMQKVSTPRPEWNEVGRKLPGGLTKWLEETVSMTSQEKMHFMVNQLTLQNNEDTEFNLNTYIKEELNFIPLFLQTDSTVKPRPMQLRDCLLLVHELWLARKSEKDSIKEQSLGQRRRSLTSRRLSQTRSHPPAGTQTKSPSSHHKQYRDLYKSFDEFLNHFFKQIYGIEQIRIEWAHTFYSMLVKEKHYYKLIELKKIIDNKMDEECHWHFESWIKSIEERILIFIDSNNNNNNNSSTIFPLNTEGIHERKKLILKQTLNEALLDIFGQKNLNRLDTLIQTASDYASLRIKEPSNMSSSSISVELPSLSNLNMKGGSEPNENQVSTQDMIDFNKLFEDIQAEDINPFISELLSIYKQLKTAFINDIVSELQKLTSNEVQQNSITLTELKNAIETISPSTAVTFNLQPKSGKTITTQSVQSLDADSTLEWIFKTNPNEPLVQSLTLNTLIKRLEGSNLFPD
ncbi:unnamed protein product [Trichobilharzia szidati]|nr:unnamed protein product [Trichobilharzia szidati]